MCQEMIEYCEKCATESMQRFVVNDMFGTTCSNCGVEISFGDEAYYDGSD